MSGTKRAHFKVTRLQIPQSTKVSFDFDGVLSRPVVQQFARELLTAGAEVWIVTMRFATRDEMVLYHGDANAVWEGNDEVFGVASTLNIPQERIIFTNWGWKSAAIRDKGFVWHLDDCPDTLHDIQINCRHTLAISCWNTSSWKDKCLKALDQAAVGKRGMAS